MRFLSTVGERRLQWSFERYYYRVNPSKIVNFIVKLMKNFEDVLAASPCAS